MMKGKFSDYVIENIDPARFKLSFLSALLEQMADHEVNINDHSMDKVYKIVVDSLAEGDVKRIKEGRQHTIQTNGTCAHDSIFSWLESSLEPEVFKPSHYL